MCLCLAIGAVAFNGESVNLVEAGEDFSCDEKGYVEYLSKWSVAEKSTSRDVRSDEFKKRLGYFVESCEKIHEWNKMKKYRMEFTFYADWHPEEFEELTTTKQRYSGVKVPVPSITPVYNNTNYRYLMPSMDPWWRIHLRRMPGRRQRNFATIPSRCIVSDIRVNILVR